LVFVALISLDEEFGWLNAARSNEYSQFGEDGVIAAIFAAIGANNEHCFECGASDGLFFSNTRRLIELGWRGVLVEADADAFARLKANNAEFGDRVAIFHAALGLATTPDDILARAGAPHNLDLAVIDVDGQDYHLFNSMLKFRPRVVMVEYNHNAEGLFIPTIGGSGQAGATAMQRLASGRMYTLVYANLFNMIFVAQPHEKALRRVPARPAA
jgi:hypothetical protein